MASESLSTTAGLRPGEIAVTDIDDPRVAAFRAVRERDAVRDGRFVAEGRIVVAALLSPASRHRVEAVLTSTRSLEAVRALRPPCPVFVATQAAMDALVGFPIHRGILAFGLRHDAPGPATLLPPRGEPARIAVAAGLANHDNVGALLRNAAAFGCHAALFDRTCCDPLYRKAIRVSAGHALTLPWWRGGTVDELLAVLDEEAVEVLALSPAGRDDVASVNWPARTALLVGPEGTGLPPAVLNRVRTVRIAMAPGIDSLNVAAAAAVALHALRSAHGAD